MAHHHNAPNRPPDEGKKFWGSKAILIRHGNTQCEPFVLRCRKGKRVYALSGEEEEYIRLSNRWAWSVEAIMSLITIASLGMVLKIMGVF